MESPTTSSHDIIESFLQRTADTVRTSTESLRSALVPLLMSKSGADRYGRRRKKGDPHGKKHRLAEKAEQGIELGRRSRKYFGNGKPANLPDYEPEPAEDDEPPPSHISGGRSKGRNHTPD